MWYFIVGIIVMIWSFNSFNRFRIKDKTVWFITILGILIWPYALGSAIIKRYIKHEYDNCDYNEYVDDLQKIIDHLEDL